VLVALTTLALGSNSAHRLLGAAPLSAGECLAAADLQLASEGDEGRAGAIALTRRAIDRSPANRDAHEMLATVIGPGPEGDDALRRAIALSPWAPEVRDQLALRLWERGEHTAAAREFEESMCRFPYLVSHAYLSPDSRSILPQGPAELVRALANGETTTLRLAGLAPEIGAAVQDGLTRALAATPTGTARASIVDDLVTVLETRNEWSRAAHVLAAEADRSVAGGHYQARAARAFLRAGEPAQAEKALLAALLDRPERGDLYRLLAVDVYAARGDFATAEVVLQAGEQNALDIVPVYRGTNEVLARRESARRRGPIAIAHVASVAVGPEEQAP
jgi:tetratricopeptide (TPR) repeat protein